MVTFTGVEDGAVDKNIPEKQSREAEIGEMHVVGKRASNIDPNNQRSTAKRKGVISPRSPKNAAKPWQLLLHSCVEGSEGRALHSRVPHSACRWRTMSVARNSERGHGVSSHLQ